MRTFGIYRGETRVCGLSARGSRDALRRYAGQMLYPRSAWTEVGRDRLLVVGFGSFVAREETPVATPEELPDTETMRAELLARGRTDAALLSVDAVEAGYRANVLGEWIPHRADWRTEGSSRGRPAPSTKPAGSGYLSSGMQADLADALARYDAARAAGAKPSRLVTLRGRVLRAAGARTLREARKITTGSSTAARATVEDRPGLSLSTTTERSHTVATKTRTPRKSSTARSTIDAAAAASKADVSASVAKRRKLSAVAEAIEAGTSVPAPATPETSGEKAAAAVSTPTPEPVAEAPAVDLVGTLVAEVKKTIGAETTDPGKTGEFRVRAGGKTLAYVGAPGKRGGIRVHVTGGQGKPIVKVVDEGTLATAIEAIVAAAPVASA